MNVVKNMSSEYSIEIFKDVFLKHGLPHHVVTDSGSQFTNAKTKKFFNNLGINERLQHQTIQPQLEL